MARASTRTCILGGGVTGLAAGYASGAPVYEAAAVPGGLCASYYVRPGTSERLPRPPADGEAYRFEVGGGHWLFGGDPEVLGLLHDLTPFRTYRRRSAVYFAATGTSVPYPLQYHLAHLAPADADAALAELTAAPKAPDAARMDAWLTSRFGPTLLQRFFGPFHDRYTAGLWHEIAPQDPYKSPIDLDRVRAGAAGQTQTAGYNADFRYPVDGLDALIRRLSERCTVHVGRRAVAIDPVRRRVDFADGSSVGYETLIATLPLHVMPALTGLGVAAAPDPYTSVLVLNIGAVRGPACPDRHWLYVPDSRAGFFRVGCYHAVDPSFLPRSVRTAESHASLYVERAYRGGDRPGAPALAAYARAVTDELRDWGFIAAPEVVDPTWIETAYTWTWPGSTWRDEMLGVLEGHGILMVGRYGRWTFQGIADSIRDGLAVGASCRAG